MSAQHQGENLQVNGRYAEQSARQYGPLRHQFLPVTPHSFAPSEHSASTIPTVAASGLPEKNLPLIPDLKAGCLVGVVGDSENNFTVRV